MALPFYQDCVVRYFRQSLHRFIGFILRKNTPSIMLPSEIYAKIVEFMDIELKLDLEMYEKNTAGYNYVLDMLIEIHVMKENEIGPILLEDFATGFCHS
jgi:hypothetical protein